MKIAVLVCGHYRDFDYAVKSWDNILSFDFYFSTWNISSHNTNKWTYKTEDVEIHESMIKDYIPHAVVDIMDVHTQYGNMIGHWKNALRLCRDSNIIYDKLIVIRPDLFIKLNVDAVNQSYNEPNTLYCRGNGDDWFEDMFFMGPRDSVETFIDALQLNDADCDPHRKLSAKMKLLGLVHKPMYGDLEFSILRPNIKLISRDRVDLYVARTFEDYFNLVYGRHG